MSDSGLILYAIVGFIMSILSSIASGGGGFIMTPLKIFLGLSPAEAIATGKIGGLSTTTGALIGMRSKKLTSRRQLVTVVVLSVVAGIISSKIIVNISGDLYSKLIGLLLIFTAPVIYKKKIGHTTKEISTRHGIIGYFLVFIALIMQGTFSSGLGIFVSLAMIVGLGLDALDANITKRTTQILLNSIIILSVFSSGLIVWRVAVVSIFVNFTGSFFGGKLAVKKGSAFVSTLLAILALLSGVGLLIV